MSRPGINLLQRTLAGMPAQAPIRSPLGRSAMTSTVPAYQYQTARLPTSTSPSRFSTRAAALLNNPTPSKPKPDSQKDTSDAVEPPVFSLASLGLGKKARVFLIVVLSILGSIETWFWCQTIWRWWKNKQEESSQSQDS